MSAKLSGKELEIMKLLMLDIPGGLHGAEMRRMAEGKLKKGTVYPTLRRMAKKGYVESELAKQGPFTPGNPPRLYSATSHGREVFDGMEAGQ